MKNYIYKSLLAIILLFAVACATEEINETEETVSLGDDIVLKNKVGEPNGPSVVIEKNTSYYVRNTNSGKYLDVEGLSEDDGANVYQFRFTGAKNQQWKNNDTHNGRFRIRSNMSKKCLEIAGSSQQNFDNAQQTECNQDDNQRWEAVRVAGSNPPRYYILTTNTRPFKALEVKDWSKKDRGNVVQYNHTKGANQQWEFYPVD